MGPAIQFHYAYRTVQAPVSIWNPSITIYSSLPSHPRPPPPFGISRWGRRSKFQRGVREKDWILGIGVFKGRGRLVGPPRLLTTWRGGGDVGRLSYYGNILISLMDLEGVDRIWRAVGTHLPNEPERHSPNLKLKWLFLYRLPSLFPNRNLNIIKKPSGLLSDRKY